MFNLSAVLRPARCCLQEHIYLTGNKRVVCPAMSFKAPERMPSFSAHANAFRAVVHAAVDASEPAPIGARQSSMPAEGSCVGSISRRQSSAPAEDSEQPPASFVTSLRASLQRNASSLRRVDELSPADDSDTDSLADEGGTVRHDNALFDPTAPAVAAAGGDAAADTLDKLPAVGVPEMARSNSSASTGSTGSARKGLAKVRWARAVSQLASKRALEAHEEGRLGSLPTLTAASAAVPQGTVAFCDGRPPLASLFDSAAAQARAAGARRVAVMICGTKPLLDTCLALVAERLSGDVSFEAHYECFGFI